METILEKFVFSTDFYLAIVMSLFIPFYWYIFKYYIKNRRENRKSNKELFFRTLLNGVKTKSLNNLEDVTNIYKGIFKLSTEDITYRYGLSSTLREFLVHLISGKFDIDNAIDNNSIVDFKELISKFIYDNDIISPFADLPTSERNALDDLTSYLNKQDIDSANRKVKEIASMIQARSDDLNKIKDTNKWSVPLSIVGMILTIVFGLIAVFK